MFIYIMRINVLVSEDVQTIVSIDYIFYNKTV